VYAACLGRSANAAELTAEPMHEALDQGPGSIVAPSTSSPD
jgi:hypothetical protein